MKQTIALLIAIVGMAGTSIAYANDWKGYAGSHCMPSSGSQDVRRSVSGAANWQDNATTVYCPVVRDIAEGGRSKIKRVNVRLFNNNNTSGGYCRLISRTLSGTTHDWEQQTWPPGYGNQTLSFGPLNTSNWGNIVLYCRLPGIDGVRKSFIKSYAVEEQ